MALIVACTTTTLAGMSQGSAATLDSKLDRKKGQLDQAQGREGVLTTTIEGYSARIADLEGRVASLHRREVRAEALLAEAQARLGRAQAEVDDGTRRLRGVRAHLRRALGSLSDRLVEIYKSGDPGVINVLISADGWPDLVARSEYLNAVQAQDDSLVRRVRELRDQARNTLVKLKAARDRIAHARDSIAAHEATLATARSSAEGRQTDLAAVRSEREATLAGVRAHARVLEGDVSALQDKIAEQLAAAQAGAPDPAGSPPPAGNQAPSSSGFIWPVQGSLVSTFGLRWGRIHEGIDIAASEGTPIQAAASGTVSLMQSEAESGGYGNYTCIDHGGGTSTCYAHQSAFGTSLGASVQQGQVIGYVGNTGHSFGAHLHFEVRVNGVAVDPLGYLY